MCTDPTRKRTACVALLLLAATVAVRLGFGFTVDDALISTRVAYHLNQLGRYAFNGDGPTVDCVTPLGWAWLLAPWSADGPWSGLQAARWLGVLCALASAGLVGALIGRSSDEDTSPTRLAIVITAACLAVNLPFGAWASSGMETGLVMLMCTSAVFCTARGAGYGFWFAGAAAALRPELIPWAFVLALLSPAKAPSTSAGADPTRTRLLRVTCVLALPLAVALVRFAVFDSPAPLAVMAKPSDTAHGLAYAWGALRLLGIPLLLVGFRSWRQVTGAGRATALAALAHVGAVVAAGGDWMSLFRLFVPIIPSLLWVGYLVLRAQKPWAQSVKGLMALTPSLMLQLSLGENVRNLWSARAGLVQELKPLVEHSRSVATLDVGWVGAATDASITDFAGVTDPEIAYLAGGHTSKQLALNLLERRQVDTLVLLLEPLHPPLQPGQPLTTMRFARAVENRAVRLHGADEFAVIARLPLPGTAQEYLVLQRQSVRID